MNALLPVVQKLVENMALQPGGERPCPYLTTVPRLAQEVGFRADTLPPGFYHALMDLEFRRSGNLFYKPVCNGCAECRPIRIRVPDLQYSRSQRRVLRRNQDVQVHMQSPLPTDEKYDLFRRYLADRHAGQGMSDDREGFEEFLYASPVKTMEFEYRKDGRLVAVGLLDLEPEAASAVYCYFDPDQSPRSPGLFNMLWCALYCQQVGVTWLYLGYYIADCRKMNYKHRITPCEILTADGEWVPFGEQEERPCRA